MFSTEEEKLNHVKNVYAFWGKFSFLYDAQDAITFFGKAGMIRRRAIESLGITQGDRVLEVACGSGRNFTYLEQAVGNSGRIFGFDYSREMLEAARRLCERNDWKNIMLIQGDAGQLEIGEANFDGVVSVLGISAVPAWEKALERCWSVLRPGGKLVVCDARLFHGFFRFLNPIVRIIYSSFAAWDPSKDILGKMKALFGDVNTESFNLGTFFIVTAVKKEEKMSPTLDKMAFL